MTAVDSSFRGKSKQWPHNPGSLKNQNSATTQQVRILTHCFGKNQNSSKSKQVTHANMWTSPRRKVYDKENLEVKKHTPKKIIWIDYPDKTFHQHDFCRASWVTVNQHIFKSGLTINFCQKQCLLVILWNEKHSSKQAVQITYTLEESFLQQLLLKVCVLFLFIKSEKTGIML